MTFNSCKVLTCTDQTEKSLIQTDCISPEGESLIQNWWDKSRLYKKNVKR